MSKKLSKVCGMIYKLRHYVPLSTLKLIDFSMFYFQIQYSLLNWGRAAKNHLHKLGKRFFKITSSELVFSVLEIIQRPPCIPNSKYGKLKICFKWKSPNSCINLIIKCCHLSLIVILSSLTKCTITIRDKKAATNFINPLLVRKLVRNHFIICV